MTVGTENNHEAIRVSRISLLFVCRMDQGRIYHEQAAQNTLRELFNRLYVLHVVIEAVTGESGPVYDSLKISSPYLLSVGNCWCSS